MTREQAKEILLLHRGVSGDAVEPAVAEALQFAKSDPELTQWLQEHQRFQESVAKELRDVEPPPDLEARILAGAKPASEPQPFGKRRQVLALAASIVLLLTAIDFWMSRGLEERTFANFRSRMVAFALRTYQMDVVSTDGAEVRRHLKSNGAPSDFNLTPGLEKLPVKGGGRLSWQNQPVGMMCFTLPSNETAFMFVIDEHAVGSPKPKTFEAFQSAGLNSVAWSKGGRLYLLAAQETSEVLAALAAQ